MQYESSGVYSQSIIVPINKTTLNYINPNVINFEDPYISVVTSFKYDGTKREPIYPSLCNLSQPDPFLDRIYGGEGVLTKFSRPEFISMNNLLFIFDLSSILQLVTFIPSSKISYNLTDNITLTNKSNYFFFADIMENSQDKTVILLAVDNQLVFMTTTQQKGRSFIKIEKILTNIFNDQKVATIKTIRFYKPCIYYLFDDNKIIGLCYTKASYSLSRTFTIKEDSFPPSVKFDKGLNISDIWVKADELIIVDYNKGIFSYRYLQNPPVIIYEFQIANVTKIKQANTSVIIIRED